MISIHDEKEKLRKKGVWKERGSKMQQNEIQVARNTRGG